MRKLHQLTHAEIKALPHDAAARKMVTRVPIVDPKETMADVHTLLCKHMEGLETVNYVYAVDEWGKFIGVLSIKDIYRQKDHHTVGEVCKREGLVAVHPDDHQERAAYIALRHHLKAVPVLDRDHHLLGVLPGDVILHILYKEMHEDMLLRVGIRNNGTTFDDVQHQSLIRSFLHRVPWLLFGMMGGLLVARLIGFFEATLERNIILATFIPLIVYMGDAVGTQMEAFMIRDLAIDRSLRFGRYFLRQFCIALGIAAVCGTLIFAIVGIGTGKIPVALVLGLALGSAVLSSVLTGLVIPYLCSRLRLDPANASGPVATIMQDFLSVLVYFLIAGALLP